ncbi:MAG: hypothetical protein ACK55I_10940, partial [bacterium]
GHPQHHLVEDLLQRRQEAADPIGGEGGGHQLGEGSELPLGGGHRGQPAEFRHRHHHVAVDGEDRLAGEGELPLRLGAEGEEGQILGQAPLVGGGIGAERPDPLGGERAGRTCRAGGQNRHPQPRAHRLAEGEKREAVAGNPGQPSADQAAHQLLGTVLAGGDVDPALQGEPPQPLQPAFQGPQLLGAGLRGGSRMAGDHRDHRAGGPEGSSGPPEADRID